MTISGCSAGFIQRNSFTITGLATAMHPSVAVPSDTCRKIPPPAAVLAGCAARAIPSEPTSGWGVVVDDGDEVILPAMGPEVFHVLAVSGPGDRCGLKEVVGGGIAWVVCPRIDCGQVSVGQGSTGVGKSAKGTGDGECPGWSGHGVLSPTGSCHDAVGSQAYVCAGLLWSPTVGGAGPCLQGATGRMGGSCLHDDELVRPGCAGKIRQGLCVGGRSHRCDQHACCRDHCSADGTCSHRLVTGGDVWTAWPGARYRR